MISPVDFAVVYSIGVTEDIDEFLKVQETIERDGSKIANLDAWGKV